MARCRRQTPGAGGQGEHSGHLAQPGGIQVVQAVPQFLNNTRFASEARVAATIRRDIASVVGTDIELELFEIDDASLCGRPLPGLCLDSLALEVSGDAAARWRDAAAGSGRGQAEQLHPPAALTLPGDRPTDWASVWIPRYYRGDALDHAPLLRYIIAYRHHQEFHEQCVERMFCDIQQRIAPEFLHIQGFYTRRGGLDINPFAALIPRRVRCRTEPAVNLRAGGFTLQ